MGQEAGTVWTKLQGMKRKKTSRCHCGKEVKSLKRKHRWWGWAADWYGGGQARPVGLTE